MEQTADKSPIPLEEAEVTQAEVQTDSDVVVEEQQDDVQEESKPEPKEDDQEPGEETQEETEEQPDKPEEPSEEDLPFHEKPGVKERLAEMEEKYSSKAEYWDAITKISQDDPEFRVEVLERLEALGRVPAGSAEAERKRVGSLKEGEEYLEKMPESVREDLKAVREMRSIQQQTQQQQLEEANRYLEDFEKARPDIATSPNPTRTRGLILNLASELMDREEIEFDSAMDKAYKTILNKSEDAQVRDKVRQNKESASAVTTGTSGSSKRLRKLSASEKRAAEIGGMTPEEYIKYADASDEELFENI